jgi:hypothetical protein
MRFFGKAVWTPEPGCLIVISAKAGIPGAFQEIHQK